VRDAVVSLRQKIAAAGRDPQWVRDAAIILVLAAVMIVGFAQVRIPGGGDDWQAFSDAARRMVGLDPGPMYNPALLAGHYYIFNPPWIVIVLLPILLLPHQWGWAVACTGMLFLGILLLRRWKPSPGPIRVVALLLSPPMLYTLLHGQVDVFVLAGMLLPVEWWWLAALAKPQDAIGIIFGVPIPKWLRAGLITGAVIVLTLVFIPGWVQGLSSQPSGFMATVNYNPWQGIWPYQVPVGIGLLALGIARKDDRFLLSASPFLSPYITTSSLIAPWLAVVAALDDWQVALIFLSWWGVIIYRMLGGV